MGLMECLMGSQGMPDGFPWDTHGKSYETDVNPWDIPWDVQWPWYLPWILSWVSWYIPWNPWVIPPTNVSHGTSHRIHHGIRSKPWYPLQISCGIPWCTMSHDLSCGSHGPIVP